MTELIFRGNTCANKFYRPTFGFFLIFVFVGTIGNVVGIRNPRLDDKQNRANESNETAINKPPKDHSSNHLQLHRYHHPNHRECFDSDVDDNNNDGDDNNNDGDDNDDDNDDASAKDDGDEDFAPLKEAIVVEMGRKVEFASPMKVSPMKAKPRQVKKAIIGRGKTL